jgi:hypothetical protein
VDRLDVAQRVRLTHLRSLRLVEEEVRDFLRTVGFSADAESRSRLHRTRGLRFTGFRATVYPLGARDLEVVYHLDDEFLRRRPREVYDWVGMVNRALLARIGATETPDLRVVGLTIYLDFGGLTFTRDDEDRFHRSGRGKHGTWTIRGQRNGKTFTGFDFGEWGRVYLKSHEIRRNRSKAYMIDAYGEYEGQVWRIEVEYDRAALNRANTQDLGELLFRRLKVVTLRVPPAPGTRKRPDRCRVDPVWELARREARTGIVAPWDAPPSLPGKWPQADAARRAQGESLILAGLTCLLGVDPLPEGGLTPAMLPAVAEQYTRAAIERDSVRGTNLVRKVAELHRLLNGPSEV